MTTPYQERKLRDPAMMPGDQPYFDAAAEGRLMLKKCGDCGEHHHYPRALCPHCFSDKVEWVHSQRHRRDLHLQHHAPCRPHPLLHCLRDARRRREDDNQHRRL